MNDQSPGWVWNLMQRLRRDENLSLTPADADTLFQAAASGFGTKSRTQLGELCCTLWAKSPREREVVTRYFLSLAPAEFTRETPEPPSIKPPSGSEGDRGNFPPLGADIATQQITEPNPTVLPDKAVSSRRERGPSSLPPPLVIPAPLLSGGNENVKERALRLTLNYNMDARKLTQTGRRLRQPIRDSYLSEPDVPATIRAVCRSGGMPTPLVMRPRLRNAARLVLFVDTSKEMTPFLGLCRLVRDALLASGPSGWLQTWYFNEVPTPDCLGSVPFGTSPAQINAALQKIPPLRTGSFYTTPTRSGAVPTAEVLNGVSGATVLVLSEGGAFRPDNSEQRLVDTFAFLNALRAHRVRRTLWLSPLPPYRWNNETMKAVQRHMTVLPLSGEGVRAALGGTK